MSKIFNKGFVLVVCEIEETMNQYLFEYICNIVSFDVTYILICVFAWG